MRLHSTRQDERYCDGCGKRFLSGLVHIQRGYLMSMLCGKCAQKDSSLERFKRLTKPKWDTRFKKDA